MVGLGNDVGWIFYHPYQKLHILIHTYLSISQIVFLPYDYRIVETSHPRLMCLVTAQIWCYQHTAKAPVWSQTERAGQRMRLPGEFAFCLQSNLLGNTVRSRG